jgi:hypothetical protein
MPETDAEKVPLQPVRPDQGLAAQGLPADRSRASSNSTAIRRTSSPTSSSRAFNPAQPGARHRRLARQDAAGAPVLLRRRAALPPGRQPPPDPGQRAALPGPQQPPRRRHARRRQLRRHARLRAQQLRPVAGAARLPRAAAEDRRRRRPLELPRGRRDYYSAARQAVPPDDPEQQQALFDNTARAMGDAPEASSCATSTTACRPTRPMAPASRGRSASRSASSPPESRRRRVAAGARLGRRLCRLARDAGSQETKSQTLVCYGKPGAGSVGLGCSVALEEGLEVGERQRPAEQVALVGDGSLAPPAHPAARPLSTPSAMTSTDPGCAPERRSCVRSLRRWRRSAGRARRTGRSSADREAAA